MRIFLVFLTPLFFLGWLALLNVRGQEQYQKDIFSGVENDLLRFFGPGDRLTGQQLHQRILKGTAVNNNFSLWFLYPKLEKLFEEGKLCKENVGIFPEEFPDFFITVYFLPNKNI